MSTTLIISTRKQLAAYLREEATKFAKQEEKIKAFVR